MNQRERNDLDRYITGNYGEDQFHSEEEFDDPVPPDFPVRPLTADTYGTAKRAMTCGSCGRSWDDGIATTWTPVPSGRCPFEYYHDGNTDNPTGD